MATNNTIPVSNPAGNNQMTPGVGTSPLVPAGTGVVTTSPLNPTAAVQSNPLIPAAPITSQSVTGQAAGASGAAFTPTAADAINPQAYNQLVDIYGGVGSELGAFEGSIAGTNSQTLQEYIASLAPQEATAQANTNASLGAAGVSANSSVAGIADSNLQAQEFAAISGESANLTQSQQSLEANLIESTLPSAQKQVADSSPLAIFGDVLGDVGSAVGDVMGLGAITGGLSGFGSMFGGGGGGVPVSGVDNSMGDFG